MDELNITLQNTLKELSSDINKEMKENDYYLNINHFKRCWMFNINSLTAIKIKKGKTLFKNDSVEYFQETKAVADALALAILEGDKSAFHEIISGYLSVINKEELSRKSKVPIATIRRMAAGANFNIDNMFKVTLAINKELAS